MQNLLHRNRAPTLALCASCFLLSALAQAASTSEINVRQQGCGGVAIGVIYGGKLDVSTTSCPVTNNQVVSKKVSAYERDLHRVLLAQNPTEFKIKRVSLDTWLEDGDRVSLNVTFENPNSLPIKSIQAAVMTPNSSSVYADLRPAKFTESNVYRAIKSKRITIPAKGVTKLPVAFLDEIVRDLHRVPVSMCAYDASPPIPWDPEEKAEDPELAAERKKVPNGKNESSHTITAGVLLRISMESIFDQKVESFTWVFIKYADMQSTADVWYPSQGRFEPLKCVNAGGGRSTLQGTK